ncbi:MAG: hypothetical protein HYV63_20070 [Candidatus Schekmanbacteria bacterium]|nr:hypothetical protein [Candidatus Schekmanbacteria bacterium]
MQRFDDELITGEATREFRFPDGSSPLELIVPLDRKARVTSTLADADRCAELAEPIDALDLTPRPSGLLAQALAPPHEPNGSTAGKVDHARQRRHVPTFPQASPRERRRPELLRLRPRRPAGSRRLPNCLPVAGTDTGEPPVI